MPSSTRGACAAAEGPRICWQAAQLGAASTVAACVSHRQQAASAGLAQEAVTEPGVCVSNAYRRPIPGHTEVMGMKAKVRCRCVCVSRIELWELLHVEAPCASRLARPRNRICRCTQSAGRAHAVASRGRSVLGGTEGGVVVRALSQSDCNPGRTRLQCLEPQTELHTMRQHRGCG